MSDEVSNLNDRIARDLQDILDALTELEMAYDQAQRVIHEQAAQMESFLQANRALNRLIEEIRKARTGEN
ncbi:hypothetical protein QR680_006932 [Steinernema hermaphroditum]|uniref:Uncharacterized protein n=1 Tax=Steinernema hermaphroditum TaxID=289476 RepID=A0AA39HX32_9BILA|nr:hypothetical protein QR680_006932 [Steinernema hermaphroditum]